MSDPAQWASWLPECNGISSPYPAIQEAVEYNPPAPTPVFDGHVSPHSVVNPTPYKSIPNWNEQKRELRITLMRHPVKPEFLKDAYREAKRKHGTVKSVVVYVLRGLGDLHSIKVLQTLGFSKNEGRSVPHGVVYVRDTKKQEPKRKPEPKPEPKELNWSERELQITSEAIKARRAIGVHETFLTGLLREQAEQQKEVDEQNAARDAVKDTEEWKELCRQEREIQKQLDELARGQTCQP